MLLNMHLNITNKKALCNLHKKNFQTKSQITNTYFKKLCYNEKDCISFGNYKKNMDQEYKEKFINVADRLSDYDYKYILFELLDNGYVGLGSCLAECIEQDNKKYIHISTPNYSEDTDEIDYRHYYYTQQEFTTLFQEIKKIALQKYPDEAEHFSINAQKIDEIYSKWLS